MKNYRAQNPQNLALTKFCKNSRKQAHPWELLPKDILGCQWRIQMGGVVNARFLPNNILWHPLRWLAYHSLGNPGSATDCEHRLVNIAPNDSVTVTVTLIFGTFVLFAHVSMIPRHQCWLSVVVRSHTLIFKCKNFIIYIS